VSLSATTVLCRQLRGTGDGEALLALHAARPGLSMVGAKFLLTTFKLLGTVFLRGHSSNTTLPPILQIRSPSKHEESFGLAIEETPFYWSCAMVLETAETQMMIEGLRVTRQCPTQTQNEKITRLMSVISPCALGLASPHYRAHTQLQIGLFILCNLASQEQSTAASPEVTGQAFCHGGLQPA